MENNLQEDLLDVWLMMSMVVSNKRLTKNMTFNEAVIYHILYKSRENGIPQLTATDLCAETRMLKSLMNNTLTRMEKKGYIIRKKSTKDKRQVLISINADKEDVYKEEHRRIIELIDGISQAVGADKTRELVELLQNVTEHMKELSK